MNDVNRFPSPAGTPSSTADRVWHRMRTAPRLAIVIAILVAIVLLAWLLTPRGGQKAPAGRFAAGGPMPVLSAPARAGDMPITLIGLGTVTPLATVTVQSQISGQIMKISFKEGQAVKANDPLMLIDPRPYDVALEQAEGALARDRALLANARVDLDRYQTLFAQDSIAEQQLATQKALVAQDEGNVKTDQGQIDAAKLNLTYCHIASPISGRVGLQQVTLGNYVTPAEPNGLVVVTQLQPITVVFTLPEDDIPPLLKRLQSGATLPVTAYDRTNTQVLATGTLQSIDSQIDSTTGTLKLKAIFPNTDQSLFPQQFVNVVLLLDTLHGATLIPQAGVQRGAPGTYVYVINADQTVSVRKVTLGPGDPTNITVTQGLKPGESVVVDGADKLKDGAKVQLRSAPGAGDQGSAAPPAGQHSHTGQGASGQGGHKHAPQSNSGGSGSG
ncbi:MAG TPA: MdtA/MuxA family multidrug efflux RND transporter periplasmic adaptor subunit [Steroidobacteraceae bacterium]|jgi:multidrug efflux system membrane fusion protein|nr:MdtA/MuxA family multidrug efflux RND transporter periplasmic adaptor subunit [Steroidobacteraceae bacterium]